ncbi:hypothetical protein [Clostridium sp.]|uniref:hypothetical protein n=1 Tax=Clostridium sp. TaxID=1506 RepID=UPI0032164EDA
MADKISVKCNSEKCKHNSDGECSCLDLRIFEHRYFDMNPYDVLITRSCNSYREN